jgi:hypothetical protein
MQFNVIYTLYGTVAPTTLPIERASDQEAIRYARWLDNQNNGLNSVLNLNRVNEDGTKTDIPFRDASWHPNEGGHD